MALGDGLAATLAALMLAGGFAAGCGGNSDLMRATLTAKGCTYDGDKTPAPGLFKVEVRNETHDVANFSLWELTQGSKIEEIEPWYARAQRKLNPPQLKRAISSSLVEPGESSWLPANEPSGRYVVLCGLDAGPTNGYGLRLFAATELDVLSTS